MNFNLDRFRLSEEAFNRMFKFHVMFLAVVAVCVVALYGEEEPTIARFGAFPIPVEQVEITTITHSNGREDVDKTSVKPKIVQAAVSVGSPVKAGVTVPQKLANAPLHVRSFIKRWLPTAADMFQRYDIPISSQLAQSAKETGWGLNGTLVKTANNFFGIKCKDKTHNHSKCVKHAGANWVKYNTAWESWKHHGQFLNAARYKECIKKQSTAAYNLCIAKAGYCYPSAGYGEDINKIIATYGLDTFDALTPAEAKAVAAKIKL